jgi:hypothetical protein
LQFFLVSIISWEQGKSLAFFCSENEILQIKYTDFSPQGPEYACPRIFLSNSINNLVFWLIL